MHSMKILILIKKTIQEFVDKFLSKELTPTLISQPIPIENTGPVIDVVAKTWDSIVMDDTKHVFVEFYAPWCGHCKRLEPTLKELAEKLQDINNLMIARIDSTANDIDPKFGEVGAYPTLKLFKMDDKYHPVLYTAKDRGLENLFEFLRENLSDLNIPKNIKDEL